MRRAMGQLQMVEGVAEAAELISAQFGLLTPPRSGAAADSQPADGEGGGDGGRWRARLAPSVDGWRKALRWAQGTNWQAVQGWLVTWAVRAEHSC